MACEAISAWELPPSEVRGFQEVPALAVSARWFFRAVFCSALPLRRVLALSACSVPVFVDDGVVRVELMAALAVGGILRAVVVDPVACAVVHVSRAGGPPEIGEPVVRWVVVPVARFHSVWAWSGERREDETVDVLELQVPVLCERDPHVPGL